MLPAEFLADSSSEDEDEDESKSGNTVQRPRKRNVSAIEKRLSKAGRGPRDERIGTTVYRVAKKTDERLAPKMQKQSKNIKEMLLKRNRAPVKARSGFLKK